MAHLFCPLPLHSLPVLHLQFDISAVERRLCRSLISFAICRCNFVVIGIRLVGVKGEIAPWEGGGRRRRGNEPQVN